MDIKIRPMVKDDWQMVSEIYKQGIESNMATLEYLCPPFDEWDAEHKKVGRFVAEKTAKLWDGLLYPKYPDAKLIKAYVK